MTNLSKKQLEIMAAEVFSCGVESFKITQLSRDKAVKYYDKLKNSGYNLVIGGPSIENDALKKQPFYSVFVLNPGVFQYA